MSINHHAPLNLENQTRPVIDSTVVVSLLSGWTTTTGRMLVRNDKKFKRELKAKSMGVSKDKANCIMNKLLLFPSFLTKPFPTYFISNTT